MSDLVIAGALQELHRLIGSVSLISQAELAIHLRALQRRGVSKVDLIVYVERLRAENDLQDPSERIEENALIALELIEENVRDGLSWDATQTAAAWVPQSITHEQLVAGARYALSGNDLLPARPSPRRRDIESDLAEAQWSQLLAREYEPTVADFYRAPKNGLTTRPAALLAPRDRLVYEALAHRVAGPAADQMPEHVVWPRGRESSADYSEFADAPEAWDAEFIIRTDIANFYETIDHTYLSAVLARHLALRGAFPIALESVLDAIMRSTVGLPQGPTGSDIIASAFLIDIDQELSDRGWPVVRYADDYIIGAQSFAEARGRIRDLEALLRERGLTLANDKTRIMRRSTYISGLHVNEAPESLRTKVRATVARWFELNPDPKYDGVIDAIELPEQIQWDVIYHQSVSWEQALSEIDDHLLPPWIRAYERVYVDEARRLAAGGYPSDEGALTTSELRRCLVFMSADARRAHLKFSHAVLDWHPTVVRDLSRYLGAVARIYPNAVAHFLAHRVESDRDSDVELAWLLSPAVDNRQLARALQDSLLRVVVSQVRPLAAATAFCALYKISGFPPSGVRTAESFFTPALRAEVALSLVQEGSRDWTGVLDAAMTWAPGST